MALPFKIISQDEFTAVSLAEAKAQCRIMPSNTIDDTYIGSLIPAAANAAQEYLHWLTSTGVVTQFADMGGVIRLQGGFVDEITEITAMDRSGNAVTLTEDDYNFNPIKEEVTISPSYMDIYITYSCGAAESQLPASVKQGVLMLVSTMYNNREDLITGLTVEKMPLTSKRLFELTRNYVS